MSEDFDGKMKRRGWVVLLGAVVAWGVVGAAVTLLVKAARRLF